eukprot:TRINITY_DN1285_c0_g2_i1.p1 TRINITY_DN1285_c0_g2~~TRINITY_DN1285_c0_g2_i1.p1  ORF type:complete len:471 (+),score=101.64 TRINITY_DN1285_c0_g2_i1:101-1513(+)
MSDAKGSEAVRPGENDECCSESMDHTPIRKCSTVLCTEGEASEHDDEESEHHHTLRDLAKRNRNSPQSQSLTFIPRNPSEPSHRRGSLATSPARDDSMVSIPLRRRTSGGSVFVNVRSPGEIRKNTKKWAGIVNDTKKAQFLGESQGEAGRFIPESPALGFTRVPSQAFSHVRDNPTVVEQATVAPHEAEDRSCPICLTDDEECDITTNCNHKFHSQCLLEYLRLRNRYACPLCSSDIEHLTLPDGEILTQGALKDKFYAPAWDLRFKMHPDYDLSFYTYTDEVKDLPLTAGQDEERTWIQTCAFPAIVIQLVDSNGNECQILEEENVDVVAQHLCPNAELFNCKVRVQNDGTAIFSNMVLQISRYEVINSDQVFPLRFQVRVSHSASDLPVHNKQIFSGVRFPYKLREGKLPKESEPTTPTTTTSPIARVPDKRPTTESLRRREIKSPNTASPRSGRGAACCGSGCAVC